MLISIHICTCTYSICTMYIPVFQETSGIDSIFSYVSFVVWRANNKDAFKLLSNIFFLYKNVGIY